MERNSEKKEKVTECWLARDVEDGILAFYGREPLEMGGRWHGDYICLTHEDLLPFPVTFEGSPVKVRVAITEIK